jgi:predicted permease
MRDDPSFMRRGVKWLLDATVRRNAVRDADAELASHLEERAELLAARGMPIEDARAEALRRLGGSVELVREELRESAQRRERRIAMSERIADAIGDLRYAARGLRRQPLFATFAIITLALGIGANAAMFGVVDRLLLRGPRYVVAPHRVVRLYWTAPKPDGGEVTSSRGFDRPVFPNLRAKTTMFSALAMYTTVSLARMGAEPSVTRVPRSSVTGGFFPLLGVQPELGRFFTQAETEAQPLPRFVVISHALWQREFGGDTAIIGRRIPLGTTPYEVIGVAPPGFTGADLQRVDLWTPMSTPTGPSAGHWTRGHGSGWLIIGRLKDGITAEQATADATNAHQRSYDGEDPIYAKGRISVGSLTLGEAGAESDDVRVSRWLIALSAVVVLVACANIMNLLLARAVARRREIAVRVSLGAGTRRLARLLFTETMLLSFAGGAAGLAIAAALSVLVRRVALPDVDWTGGVIDSRVLLYALGVCVFVCILLGVGPVLRAQRLNIVAGLRAGAGDGGGRRSFARGALMLAQSALAMVLLIGAGLFVRSFQRVTGADLGIETNRVIRIDPVFPSTGSDWMVESRQRDQFAELAIARLRQLPNVEQAALSVSLPFSTSGTVSFALPGRDSLPSFGNFKDPDVSKVSPEYFATVGTRLLRGRLFTRDDGAGGRRVGIVSQTMARALWPGQDPLGQCMLIGDAKSEADCAYVVGVVQDVRRRSVREEPFMHYYVPLTQGNIGISGYTMIVRPKGDAKAAIPALRQVMRQLAPQATYIDLEVLQDKVDPQLRTWRIGAIMFSIFAGLALVVAAVGLFSVVAYLVEQRRHELGIRIALGAGAGDVIGLVMRGVTWITAGGVVLGGIAGVIGGKLAEPLLYETTAAEPRLLGGLAAGLIAVSLLASGIPALRARKVEAMTVLRDL